jgi:hypothetical protein
MKIPGDPKQDKVKNGTSSTGYEKKFEKLWDTTLESLKSRSIYKTIMDLESEDVLDTLKTIADIFFAIGIDIGNKEGAKKLLHDYDRGYSDGLSARGQRQ